MKELINIREDSNEELSLNNLCGDEKDVHIVSDITIEDSNVNDVDEKSQGESVVDTFKNTDNNSGTNNILTGAYQKNVLREMSKKMSISPIHIEKKNIDDNSNISSDDYGDYDFGDSYLKEESVSFLEEMEDSYEVNDSMKSAGEIVSRMEEEIKPSNIELTDYEKKQEEEAIISYDELQKFKDKIYNITEEEETDEFIDELRNFRLDL